MVSPKEAEPSGMTPRQMSVWVSGIYVPNIHTIRLSFEGHLSEVGFKGNMP